MSECTVSKIAIDSSLKSNCISLSPGYTTIGNIYDQDKEDTINNANCDGYISSITLGGKRFKIRAEVVEVFPTVCKKCGASFEMHHGEGCCPFCNTHYTTMYKVVEE